jgi:hypothetical protein
MPQLQEPTDQNEKGRRVCDGSRAAENENHGSVACGSFGPAADVVSTNRLLAQVTTTRWSKVSSDLISEDIRQSNRRASNLK